MRSPRPADPRRERANRPGENRESGEANGRRKDGDWAETFRKMMENPVGQAMIKEEHKMKALKIYGAFFKSLDLSKEEEDYFLDLVGGGLGEEDAVGIKIFTASSDEERVQILDQMEVDQEKRRQAIRDFLNDDEDFERYEFHDERKEIYEQMPGLRAAMKGTGTPMSEDQETQIVEAMLGAAQRSGLNEEWDGRAGMEQLGRPGATQRFEASWVRCRSSSSRMPAQFWKLPSSKLRSAIIKTRLARWSS